MIISFIDDVAACGLVLLVGFYAGYAILCYFYGRRARPILGAPPETSLPTLTIIVPTYNEAKVIEARLENLRTIRYSRDKLQVVFVDSGSTDGTPDLIDKLKGELNVELVRRETREGYNKALIDGFKEATGELIAFTGAETQFEPDALIQMVKHFMKKDVAAVTGRQQIRNLTGVSPAIEAGYRSLYDFVRLAESEMDSPFDIKGEICVGRREVVGELMARAELARRGCVDGCLSFQSRRMGMKTVYEPAAVYYEDSPYRISESFAQEIRRGTTLIENMLLFKGMILNRRYGKFGTVIMPAHFMMLVIMPFLFLLTTIALVLGSIISPYAWTSIVIILGAFATGISRSVQGFVKAQLCLIAASIGLVMGSDTQRFKRLASTRMLK